VTDREVLLVVHPHRPVAVRSAERVVAQLSAAGIGTRLIEGETGSLHAPDAAVVSSDERAARDVELVMVLGGDGTLLRAAELARPAGAPILGVNLGRVGFLAEAEQADLGETVDRVVARQYEVEERMTVDVTVTCEGTVVGRMWALNDCAVEKAAPQQMLDVIVEIDGRPLSRWGCDGVVCATPTGSTAYAFSAGGPIVWPEVEALLLVPISAHALFSRPIVVAPTSVLAVEILSYSTVNGLVSCDGRRTLPLRPPARVETRRGEAPVRLARLRRQPFTDRLVSKFALPVQGWRGGGH
jgi:NAD+ kinase